TTVADGALRVNGDQSAATGLTSVASGAALGGSGIIGGGVTVAHGGMFAPGHSPGTLTLNCELALSDRPVLDYEFRQAHMAGGVFNDLINVGGDLVLDGEINVSASAGRSFDAGIYRIFSYDGDLTDRDLEIGAAPASSQVVVQTSIANQVNLVNTAGMVLNF